MVQAVPSGGARVMTWLTRRLAFLLIMTILGFVRRWRRRQTNRTQHAQARS